MVLVNLALLILVLTLTWYSWRQAGRTGSVAQIWMSSMLILASCYYLVVFIVSTTG